MAYLFLQSYAEAALEIENNYDAFSLIQSLYIEAKINLAMGFSIEELDLEDVFDGHPFDIKQYRPLVEQAYQLIKTNGINIHTLPFV
ncbi:hypothetical protein [Ferrimonas senticii]|uniref:hypothetical protein n=1 Tax=Ferrimonas senticii TaxID=394566 RepID=UPI0004804019|nr:hypothetical protein [Ferrimonas senticii]